MKQKRHVRSTPNPSRYKQTAVRDKQYARTVWYSDKKVEDPPHFLEDLVFEAQPTKNERVFMGNLTELYCLIDNLKTSLKLRIHATARLLISPSICLVASSLTA